MHDLLLAKKGIAAPATHPLRLAVTKHKARLSAELTKARLKGGFKSIEDLRIHVDIGSSNGSENLATAGSLGGNQTNEDCSRTWPHPRWVRVNTLRTNLEEQLATTFFDYETVDSVEEIVKATRKSPNVEKLLHVDKHIPDLLALPAPVNVSNTSAYRNGLIILQDKASCFPAYLLDPRPENGPFLDACAAPGNKTTHLAAILRSRCSPTTTPKVWACERDKNRATVLQQMLTTAGAEEIAEVKPGQDFLRLDPQKAPWDKVCSLLLDPSCSGSGIIGREEVPSIVLPSKHVETLGKSQSKKRKRKAMTELGLDPADLKEETPIIVDDAGMLRKRLEALSAFQLKLIIRAFQFPKAHRITYSTCSIYAEENEHVVIKALDSPVAKQHGWYILRREEQVSGMKAWTIRGDVAACREILSSEAVGNIDPDEIAEGCIRCEKETKEGTQGFFVAAFARDGKDLPTSGLSYNVDAVKHEHEQEDGEQWEGFDD